MVHKNVAVLIYDKECPACNNYCQWIRIKESIGELRLVDARSQHQWVDGINQRELDIDQGMLLIIGEQWYYGHDAIHTLALISSPSTLFNRFNALVFRSKTLSRYLYPCLRSMRNLLLKILGKTKINNLNIDNNSHF